MIKKLDKSETILRGAFIFQNNKVIADEVSKRIEYLTTNYLKTVGTSGGGWETLYIDDNDSRYWELSYPDGEMHGGGPSTLVCLSLEEATKKYHISATSN
jgi:hypothetical protein